MKAQQKSEKAYDERRNMFSEPVTVLQLAEPADVLDTVQKQSCLAAMTREPVQ